MTNNKTLSITTKKGFDFFQRYEKATETSVYQHYKKVGKTNAYAEKTIIREMVENNGYGYKVLCGGSYSFTCGYLYTREDGVEVLVIHTRDNRYLISLN